MKYLGPTNLDDIETVRTLAKLEKLDSHPELATVLEDLEAQYKHYISSAGNVLKLNDALVLTEELTQALKRDYKRKLVALRYIKRIREESSPDICPMCGSFAFGQVDHIAPQVDYPEFSLFSKNLVPACNCNGRKNKFFRDPATSGRILHPYYDEILKERLVYLSFEDDDWDTPTLRLELVIGHSNNPAVKFHVEKILRRSNIYKWASKQWAKLKIMPIDILNLHREHLKKADSDQIKKAVAGRCAYFDKLYGTPNNWESMFYWGISTKGEGILQYLSDRVNVELNP